MFPHLVCVSVDGAVVQKQSAAVAHAAEQQQQQADGGEGRHGCGHRCGRLQSVALICNKTFHIGLKKKKIKSSSESENCKKKKKKKAQTR